MKLKIALLQANVVPNDPEVNLAIGEGYCREAADKGADIALFPEMWNIGYTVCPQDETGKAQWASNAIETNSPFLKHFQQLAQELEIAIGITYLEKWNDSLRNSFILYDLKGQEVLKYAKVHTCDFGMDAACTPGDDFYVATLGTKEGSLKVGAMICYDREFPESARILMLKGAELILVPNACTLEEHRTHQFKTRGFENMVALAMTNYPSPIQNGNSLCVDGVCFDETGNTIPNLIYQAPEEEGLFIAEIDITRLRCYRKKETWGNAYRKPSCYHTLVASKVNEPFNRQSAKR